MQLIDQVPIWLVIVLTFGVTSLAFELGFRAGVWRSRNRPKEDDKSLGALVGGLLGLLAFMLAFTTGFALNQYINRKSLVIQDANSIGTTYLRTDFLPPDDGDAAKALLREYTDIRIAAASASDISRAVARTREIQDELWAIAVRNGNATPDSEVVGLFIDALNTMIDTHTERVTFTQGARVPSLMWGLLYGLSIVSFLMTGVQSSHDGKRNLLAMLLFTLGFSAVIVLIIELDRSQQGLLTVSQQALLDLQQQLNAAP
ncbi:MAG: hypothetical protein KIS95_13950 [Anaerolineae bacterium]|uniref:bestrophin-like domain n=1 Tax=Promineifilum sp. TaxID=2664178 RepID=UPI001DBA6CCF|nr:hypothetical protein [Anaerolineales bacterium]MCB8934862.1 hypothetical protein [Promineifilum sp.]MCO5181194.1 hypothetical protein [Promineifilum sp.]MCW5848331.1 hypothetical protein [Anaerolineae bacterium]